MPTAAKPKPTKAPKGKPMKPSDAFPPAPPNYVNDPASREQMLRAAILVKPGAKERWMTVLDAGPDGQPAFSAIIDVLTEEWADDPACAGDAEQAHPAANPVHTPWSWATRGGAIPAIWFGQRIATSEPHLQGFALAAEVRPILQRLGDEREALPPIAVPLCEQPPHGVLAIDRIHVVANPRKTFDDSAMQELTESIRAIGIVQAVTVSPPDADGRYTLIAGERRYRAAKAIGLTTVPVYVRPFVETDAPVAQIAENLNRRGLTPIEEAQAYRQLLDGGLSQRALAAKLGLSQGLIGNRVRLLKLPAKLQEAIVQGAISSTEGRDLANWTDRPAVINEFVSIWEDNIEFEHQKRFVDMLRDAVRDASRSVGKGHDGPRFKLTDEVRRELDIVAVKIPGRLDEERAFFTPLWDELQAKAAQERMDKYNAKQKRQVEAAKAAGTQQQSDEPADEAPPKPHISRPRIETLWCGWFARQLVQRFTVKKLKPVDAEHLSRLAILLLEPLPNLIDELGLTDRSEDEMHQALAAQTVEGLLDALRRAVMHELRAMETLQYGCGIFASDTQARLLCDSVGISLRTFAPDRTLLAAIPDEILLDFAAEYEMRPSKVRDKLIDQLLDCWTVGWIPAPLNVFPAVD